MRNRLIGALIGSAAAVSMLSLSAAPAQAGGHDWFAGTTTVTLEPSTVASFTAAGIEIDPLLAAETVGATTSYAFKVTGDPADGTVELLGGFLFYDDDCVLFSRLVIDEEGDVLTGKVNLFGPRIDLFQIGGPTPAGLTIHFTAAGAAAFNEELGTTALRPGRILGYYSTVLD